MKHKIKGQKLQGLEQLNLLVNQRKAEGKRIKNK